MSNEPKIVKVDPPKDLEVVEARAIELPANEIEAQIAAAHRHPRSLKKFMAEAREMATLTEDIAESCLYRLKRWDPKLQKEVPLIGGSVRLAEICLSAWGNCHAGARPVEETFGYVRAQGVCWDVERNVRVTMETTRGVTKANGERYKSDLVIVTMNAAGAIAFRNAVFKIVPVALVDEILEAAKKAAVGDGASKRAKVIRRLGEYGATVDRILASLGRKAIEDITLEDLEILIASGSTLKAGDQTVDELFPPVTAAGTAAAPSASAPAGAPATQAQAPAQTATAPASGAPKQGTLAAVAARGRTNRGAPPAAKDVDNLISGPPARLQSVPAEAEDKGDAPTAEELAKAGSATSDDELPPWAGGSGS